MKDIHEKIISDGDLIKINCSVDQGCYFDDQEYLAHVVVYNDELIAVTVEILEGDMVEEIAPLSFLDSEEICDLKIEILTNILNTEEYNNSKELVAFENGFNTEDLNLKFDMEAIEHDLDNWWSDCHYKIRDLFFKALSSQSFEQSKKVTTRKNEFLDNMKETFDELLKNHKQCLHT